MSIVQMTQTSARPVVGQPGAPTFALPTQTVAAPTDAPATGAAPSPTTPPLVAPTQTAVDPGQTTPTGGPALTTAQHHWGAPRIGAGLFANDWQRLNLDQIGASLGHRFGPVLRAGDLTSGLNMSWSDAQRFVQHHGQGGEVALPDLMNHVSRFASGWDGSMNRAGFENAMRNGANALNFGRFEVGRGMGVDVNGFMEMARRAGAKAPDHLLQRAFERAAASGWGSDRTLLDPSEMARHFGVHVDRGGDFPAHAFASGVDRAATPPPPPPQHSDWNPWRSGWQPRTWNSWC